MLAAENVPGCGLYDTAIERHQVNPPLQIFFFFDTRGVGERPRGYWGRT